MLDITGAGTQPPMHSHWELRSGPLSYKKKNREQQCKCGRANTASGHANATEQTRPQQTAKLALQGRRPSNSNLYPCPTASAHPSPLPPQMPPCCCRAEKGEAAVRRLTTFTFCPPHLRLPVHHRCQVLGPRRPGHACHRPIVAVAARFQPDRTSAYAFFEELVVQQHQ